MFEPLILVLLSMLIGGAVVQQGGMKSLSLLIAGILVCLIFYGGILGMIVGMLGIMAIIVSWFVSGSNKPLSPLYMNNSQKNNIKQPHKIDSNLSREYQDSFKRGLDKKYPANSPKDRNWVERIQNNLRIGLAQKYPAK